MLRTAWGMKTFHFLLVCLQGRKEEADNSLKHLQKVFTSLSASNHFAEIGTVYN